MSECTHDCNTCGGGCGGGSGAPVDFRAALAPESKVKHVYAIMSGKGGVGKSLVTSLLAVAFNKKGYRTAILDADITGPSIPMAFGVDGTGLDVTQDGNLMIPVESMNGTQIVSANLLLRNDTDPIIWRGAMIAGAVKQFWSETLWKDVDYMFVDMPPGTGDVPLTVFQSLPVDGIIVVTSPQELVSMIVAKAVNMAKKMDIPIVGLVENMSYFEAPDTHKRYQIFGESHLEETAKEYNLGVLAKLPIDPDVAAMIDAGKAEYIDTSVLDKAVADIIAIDSLLDKTKKKSADTQ
ncbi:MAG: Mrp/NBP35 family ATP-binding protein [Eubacteriales bacterium]|nr:Mrp/NBP35 family ATP-binding protein [Eubacteriales bacterium]